MIIDKKIDQNKVILTIEGRLDTQTAPQLETAVDEILKDCAELILDLKEVEYISSAGLRIILKAQKSMNKQGSLKLRNVNETVMEVFDITGFLDILTIE